MFTRFIWGILFYLPSLCLSQIPDSVQQPSSVQEQEFIAGNASDTSELAVDSSGANGAEVHADTSDSSQVINTLSDSNVSSGVANDSEDLYLDSQYMNKSEPSGSSLTIGVDSNEINNRENVHASINNSFKPVEERPVIEFSGFGIPFNPFDFENRIMMQVCVHHLYYNERFPKEDIVQSFIDEYGVPPDTIEGKPKSTESGMLLGYSFKYMKRFHQSGIFLRPQFQFVIGIGNRYDGSLQGVPVSNELNGISGVKYTPMDTTKNNFFFNTEFDIGYSNHNKIVPFALYSGLRFCFWNRDLLSNEYVTNAEHYNWWNVPVGLMIYKPVGPRWVLGIDATVDWMFTGGMKIVTESNMYDDPEIEFPSLKLGNRCGYRLELVADGMVNERFSIQISPYLNVYGFGKSNTEYATYYGNYNYDVNYYQNREIPFYEPESATFIAGLNLTFTILMSRIQ